ncbi:hypothetical protein B0I35DRAFT_414972 [Stachybotrys elegans]|uniref:Ig-like domain-containing protein n=1 Tax=Stachybotrys elegans TaxID=80388 RepID=A0A8K0SDC8_9HYPO|nr:hypothetical protein B0I35DRAFT_414972 [Stachybotrys elegans]
MMMQPWLLMAALGFAFTAADEIHFVNCQNTSPSQPLDIGSNICHPSPGVTQWERSGGVSCRFPISGVVFQAALRSDAASAPNFTVVGIILRLRTVDSLTNGRRSGSNGFNTYTCYKDNGHSLYVDNDAKVCFSLYYCLQN